MALVDQPRIIQSTFAMIMVCVPDYWTDEQIEQYVEISWPTDRACWRKIRKQGKNRVPCADMCDYVHVLIDN